MRLSVLTSTVEDGFINVVAIVCWAVFIAILVNLVRYKNRQKYIEHLRAMEKKYPDAYAEWYGPLNKLESLSYDELQIRARKSESSWKSKQRKVLATLKLKRKAEEAERERVRKRERSAQASSWARMYPNAVKELIGVKRQPTESQIDELLNYSETFVKEKEEQIVAERERLRAQRREEVDRKYNILVNSYPNAVEHIKMLRTRLTRNEELYTRNEWADLQGGLTISNEKTHMIRLPKRLYEKYEPIALQHRNIVDWHNKQILFSKTARRLKDLK